MRPTTFFLFILAGLLAAGLELLALASWLGWLAPKAVALPVHPGARTVEVRELPPLPRLHPTPFEAGEAYYDQLRARLRWMEARVGGQALATLDLPSRMLLAKSAARRAKLHEVGLGFQDVYGIINAETSWVPRAGASRDGTPNIGIAQFEPATAAALGVRDPHDVVEAVHAAAEHMREAAQWSAARIAGLKLSRAERAERLREGVSIYYNLSSRGRAVWNGRNEEELPAATRAHIRNARLGAQEAAWLASLPQVVEAASLPAEEEAVLTAEAGARR